MTNCKCPPASPFLWRENTSALDTTKMKRNAALSSRSTSNVNAKRRQGIELMTLGPMSNKPLAHSLNPKAGYLQPTIGRSK
jgi:hypothetical protein